MAHKSLYGHKTVYGVFKSKCKNVLDVSFLKNKYRMMDSGGRRVKWKEESFERCLLFGDVKAVLDVVN